MKRKVWTISPLFLIFSIAMLLMAFATYHYNMILAVAETILALLVMALVIVLTIRFKKYINKTITKAISNFKDVNQSYLERFKMPVVVTGKFGEILWSNSRFKKRLCNAKDPVNENVALYLGKNITDISDEESFDIVWEGKQYSVYCTDSDDCYVCFFVDDTYFKETAAKYTQSQKAVALIMLDNYDDFSNDTEAEAGQILLYLEMALNRYAESCNALIKKLNANKYMMIFDKIYLEREITKKFPVLKEVRSIKYRDIEATVSVGIGNVGDSLKESEVQARKALDMALGRGGDQVVVSVNNNYEFFGGVSGGVEKLSKVRTRIIAASIQRVISESDRVFIMGHRYADLDCVGAAVGLQPVIQQGLKKQCKVIIEKESALATQLIDEIEKSNNQIFVGAEEALKEITPKTLLIVVDTHIPNFVQSKEVLDKCKRVVVIDHHRKMVNFIDNSLVFFHEPMSSSASEMVTELITYLGEDFVSKTQANALLAGIMLDTKNFVVRTGVRTFEAAAFLRKNGANTVEIKSLFASNIQSYKQKYKIVSSAEVVHNCAVAVVENPEENIRMIAAQAADELLSVSEVSASFVIFKTGNIVNISARSYGKINVQMIMEKMGGGGHQNMAAAQLKHITLEQGRNRLLDTIKEAEFDNDNEN